MCARARGTGDPGPERDSGPLPVPAETVSSIYLTAYRIASYPVVIQRQKAKMNDPLYVDMGSKPPTIKFQTVSSNFAERPFFTALLIPEWAGTFKRIGVNSSQPDEGSHPATAAITAMGKPGRRICRCTSFTAPNLFHTRPLQTLFDHAA